MKCEIFSLQSVTETLICNGKTVYPYFDSENCGGCGINCGEKKCIAGQCDTYGFGKLVSLGHYEQDNNPSNGPEPIIWRVVNRKPIVTHIDGETTYTSGGFLLVSEKALIAKRFNEESKSVTWEASTLRSWLNGYDDTKNSDGIDYSDPANNFYDAAFTNEEKETLSRHDITKDKVSILTLNDISYYFKNEDDRRADTTPYAQNISQTAGRFTPWVYSDNTKTGGYRACGADDICYSDWWIRNNQTTESPKAPFISYFGTMNNPKTSIAADGASVDNWEKTVRPAIWVKF